MTDPRRDDVAIGALRAFLTLLVIAHHAVLAYHPFIPPPAASLEAAPQWWRAFPVVDDTRWSGFMWLAGWNDSFFMALMFFVSGLFVWSSLTRKGPGTFLRDRALRLGLPFLAAVALLAPLAYVPAYLQTGAEASVTGFGRAWLAAGDWSSGPAWFLWLLLAFDLVAAGLFATLRPRLTGGPIRRPILLFAALVVVSAVAYVPLTWLVAPSAWSSFGPFQVQTGRVLHYLAYFLVGVVAGARGLEPARLARGWPLWLLAAAGAFAFGVLTVTRGWAALASASFVLTCAATSFALLAVFSRFAGRASFTSLRAHAFGMYLVHYVFVTWLQYALLAAPLPGLAKGVLVTVGAATLSYLSVAAARRLVSWQRQEPRHSARSSSGA